MFLKALEIQGFKSFPDRTKITFEGGITAVVGPNGSGKSNISDAIRWVLGETSSKQLRGAGKMEDVIFGGTQKRSPMGYAAVSLYIDNSAHRLDVESSEVVITRRYYRSGESKYGINGQNVRLGDIHKLLWDTGIGRDGYSIIGQGRIAEIVGAKSAERREIFEEASGIAGYRHQKNESERRLAAAQANMERVRDVLDVLEARVGPLEKESEKAKKFLGLAGIRKELEVTLYHDTLRRARENVRKAQRDMEIAQADYDRASAGIDRLEEETAGTREEIARANVSIERANTEIRSITEQMSGRSEEIAVLENDISHNEASIRDLQLQIEQAGRSEEETAGRIREEEEKAAAADLREEDLTAEIDRLADLLEQLAGESEKTGERKGVILARLTEISAQLTDLKVSDAAAVSDKENADLRLAAIAQDDPAEKLAQLKQERRDTRVLMEEQQDQLTRLENIKEGLSTKLASREKQLEQAQGLLTESESKLNAAAQRIRILKELEASMDGYNRAVKNVLQAAQERRLRGIVGPVSSLLLIAEGYETAIETALGQAVQNIVTTDDTAAAVAMDTLKKERWGRVTFLPLNTVQPREFYGQLPAGARLAKDLVRADDKYRRVVENLLGNIVVVADLTEARRAARELRYKFRVVTLDGQVINAGGSFTGGSTEHSAGMFTRRAELVELKKRIETLTARRDANAADAAKLKAECESLTAQITAVESEHITASGEKIRAEAELSRIKMVISQLESAAELLEAEAEQLAKTLENSAKTLAENEKTAAKLAQESEKLEAELAGIADGDDTALATRTRLADELSQAKLDRLEAQKDAQLARHLADNLRRATSDAADRTAVLNENIAGLKKAIEENRDKIAAIEAQKAGQAAAITAKETEKQQQMERRDALEASITTQNTESRRLQDEREKLSQEIARQEERKDQLEKEYDSATQKLWEEYELTPGDAAGMAVEFESITQLRRDVAEVRGKIRALGNVNVGAIDEFVEVNAQYQEQKKQASDVEASIRGLEEIIASLAGEMRTIFAQNFNRINENFGRIFALLFGGGTASLSLSDPEDVLESGIDITVAPPGKVIKNLTALSGGEQALVAISIYFAILAVNPAPFCVLDEIEAALDDVNVVRFAQYMRRITKDTQFIVITHRRGTMEEADMMYGVTMQENGVSTILRKKDDIVELIR